MLVIFTVVFFRLILNHLILNVVLHCRALAKHNITTQNVVIVFSDQLSNRLQRVEKTVEPLPCCAVGICLREEMMSKHT